MTMGIKKNNEFGIRIARVGQDLYEVQFREFTKSGKPKWVSNALMRTGDLETAKKWFKDLEQRKQSQRYSNPVGM